MSHLYSCYSSLRLALLIEDVQKCLFKLTLIYICRFDGINQFPMIWADKHPHRNV